MEILLVEIKESNKKERGTEIILHINDDSKEFLEEAKIMRYWVNTVSFYQWK